MISKIFLCFVSKQFSCSSGIICLIYSLCTFHTPLNSVSEDICSEGGAGNLTMCPVCDRFCEYWKLKDSCILSQLTYFFDNEATIFFAVFMSFWATMFLELWKRKQAILQWEWDTTKDDTVEDSEYLSFNISQVLSC